MLHRSIRATIAFAHHLADQSAKWAMIARNTAGGFLTTAHHALMFLGVGAIAALVTMFVKPEFTEHLKTLSPFTVANAETTDNAPVTSMGHFSEAAGFGLAPVTTSAPPAQVSEARADIVAPATQRQQQWVTYWLAKRYHVAGDATNMLVSAAYVTAKEIKLDPLLILAVMAIESGLNPFAESPVGAQGLMQVMSKLHHEKFQDLGGVQAALNPVANIKVGSLILKDYVTRGGSVEAGLKLYVGAAAFETDSGYGSKVLAEYHRLKEVATGKNVSIFTTPATVVQQKPRPLDAAAEPKAGTAVEVDADASKHLQSPRLNVDRVAAL